MNNNTDPNTNTNTNTNTNSIAKNKTNLTVDNINKSRSADVILDKLDCYLKALSETAQNLEKSISKNETKITYFKQKKTKLDKLLDKRINEINNNYLSKSNRQLIKYKNMAKDNASYNQHVKDTKNNISSEIKTLHCNIMEVDDLRRQMNKIVNKIGDNIDFRVEKGNEMVSLYNSMLDCFTELDGILTLTKSQYERADKIKEKHDEILFDKVVNMGKINDDLKIKNKKIEGMNNESCKDVLDFKDKVATYLNPISTSDVLSNTTVSFNCKTDISSGVLFNKNITNGCNILIVTTKH
nr:hypothetical protein [uncultured Moellerella sp.]